MYHTRKPWQPLTTLELILRSFVVGFVELFLHRWTDKAWLEYYKSQNSYNQLVDRYSVFCNLHKFGTVSTCQRCLLISSCSVTMQKSSLCSIVSLMASDLRYQYTLLSASLGFLLNEAHLFYAAFTKDALSGVWKTLSCMRSGFLLAWLWKPGWTKKYSLHWLMPADMERRQKSDVQGTVPPTWFHA